AMTAQYLLAECDSAWSNGLPQTLTLTVTPPAVGTFTFYVRSAMHNSGGTACEYYNYPESSSTTDQQSWAVTPYTVTVNSVPPAPVASFTAVPTSGNAPLTVLFSDTSTGSPTSWSWTFGDSG